MSKTNWIAAVIFIIPVLITGSIVKVNQKMCAASISDAIIKAASGDTIFFSEGTYFLQELVIPKKLVLMGSAKAVLDGNGKNQILTIRSDSVVISGLVFKHSGVSFIRENSAVYLDSVKGCIVRGNNFTDNYFAVYLARSSDCIIENNKIEASSRRESLSGNGIHLWYCRNISISNNIINGHRDGIYLEFARECGIFGNKAAGNLRYGLHFMFSDSCSYNQNSFTDNGAGVAVMYTKNVTMQQNKFIGNWGGASYGILLKDISKSSITQNYFYKNSCGIYVEGCADVNVQNNDFIENGWAVRLMANSVNNLFNANNFISNTFDISTNNIRNYNSFSGNYWSEYAGYDRNRDGYGDVGYRPVRLFSLIAEMNEMNLILLRSFAVHLLDLAEKAFPLLTPETLIDDFPKMRKILNDTNN